MIMNANCQTIVFSNKAYNAIIDETFKKEPIETGGILLGHILDNGIWIVMEVLPPGMNSIHEYAYFEYDDVFVNYLAQSVATKYQIELNLLGLWHRHPGSMDVFSGTDDRTNLIFANLNPKGAISGLVNVDPNFRLTMRHVSSPLSYEVVDFEVGDDLIPGEYFELKHFPEKGLHPSPSTSKKAFETVIGKKSEIKSSSNNKDEKHIQTFDDKLKSILLYPICILSLLLMLLGINKYSPKNDNVRLVSTEIHRQLDTVAFEKAVTTYFDVVMNDKQYTDSISKENFDFALSQSIETYNRNMNRTKIIVNKEYKNSNNNTSVNSSSKKWFFPFSLLVFLLSFIAITYDYFYKLYLSFINKSKQPWYVKNSKTLLSEEYDLKHIAQSCEKSIENDTVSFIVVTDKQYDNIDGIIAYQIVYPQEFQKEKKIKI